MSEMRLQKYLARAGVASRRASEEYITAGRVSINGVVVTELGTRVDPDVDVVAVDGQVLQGEVPHVTIMLNKPAGYVTTMSDPEGRPTVAELIPLDEYPGLYPIGRLDRDTTGLLLFSTNGELGHALMHPRKHVEKHYIACVEGRPSEEELEQLRQGVVLDDGPTQPALAELLVSEEVAYARSILELPPAVPHGASLQYSAIRKNRAKKRGFIRIGIHEGRNRQVRRMCGFIKHKCLALHRESLGPLELGDLPQGKWRMLSQSEVDALLAASQCD